MKKAMGGMRPGLAGKERWFVECGWRVWLGFIYLGGWLNLSWSVGDN